MTCHQMCMRFYNICFRKITYYRSIHLSLCAFSTTMESSLVKNTEAPQLE
jgi:hypothetical protein